MAFATNPNNQLDNIQSRSQENAVCGPFTNQLIPDTIGIRGCRYSGKSRLAWLVDHAQSRYIGETRVDIA